jgi:hypothetical protein
MSNGWLTLLVTPMAAGFGVSLVTTNHEGGLLLPSPSLEGGSIIAHECFASSLYPLSTHLIQGIETTIRQNLPHTNPPPWRQTIAAIVTTCGPGSFTSLRTTMAALQGLSIGLNVPFYAYTRTHLYQYHSTQDRLPCLLVIHQNRPTMLGYELYPDASLSSKGPLQLPFEGLKDHATKHGLAMMGDIPTPSLNTHWLRQCPNDSTKDEARLLLAVHHSSRVEACGNIADSPSIFYGTKAYYEV